MKLGSGGLSETDDSLSDLISGDGCLEALYMSFFLSLGRLPLCQVFPVIISLDFECK